MSYPVLNEGGPNDTASIPLATSKGRWIRNVRRLDRAPDAMRAAEKTWRAKFSLMRTRSLSATYNCFGMVFAARRTWIISPEDVELILTDDGYRKVPNRAELSVGDVVVYRTSPGQEITHMGTVVDLRPLVRSGETEFTVMSQWGADGEYLHKEHMVPDKFGPYREYYSERKLI